jgi:uncharacterized membrane protein
MLRTAAALLVFVIEAWAIAQVLGSPLSKGRRIRWIAAIVLLPVVGVVLWLRTGPQPSARARHMV